MTDLRPDPIAYRVAPLPALFQSLRSGAIAFGVIFLVLGATSGCFVLLIPLSLAASRPARAGQLSVGGVVGGAVLYLAVAVGLIWLGIGAIRLRRWVRPIVLTAGTLTALSGVYTLVILGMTAPATRESMLNRSKPLPADVIQFVLFFTMIFVALFGVALPGAFVWFFRKPNVEAMLDYFDPVPRWTDGCPVPVLGVAVALVFYAVSPLIAAPQGMAPVFGTVLTGLPAVATDLALAGIALALAWLTFRRALVAWWGVLIFTLAVSAAYAMTLARGDYLMLFRRAGFTERQLAAIESFEYLGPTGRLGTGAAVVLFAIAYLIYVRRQFQRYGSGI